MAPLEPGPGLADNLPSPSVSIDEHKSPFARAAAAPSPPTLRPPRDDRATPPEPRPPTEWDEDDWSDPELRRLVDDRQHKTIAIVRSMMDQLSAHPNQHFTMADLAPGTGHPSTSVRAAMNKLQPHLDKWYRRKRPPFTKAARPGGPFYSVSTARAAQWLALRD